MNCMSNYRIVKNARLLKRLERLNLIKFHPQTLTKIRGLYSDERFICYYIDEAPYKFEFEDRIFGQKYFDGCFQPYLVEYFNNIKNN